MGARKGVDVREETGNIMLLWHVQVDYVGFF